jgi:hypothetical protein
MPTKRNRAGNQQPYVPEGNGDASGEYTNNESGTISTSKKGKSSNNLSINNFTKEQQLEQLKQARESVVGHIESLRKQKHQETDDKFLPKYDKLIADYENTLKLADKKINDLIKETGTPAEREKLRDKGISTITEDMKSTDYTKKFCKNVKISRASLSKDEIGEFNSYLETLFDEYPDMQKFDNITVKNNMSSHKGGYVMPRTNYFTDEVSYDLYINSGWLEDRQKINDSKFKNRIETINEESKKPKEQVYNVVAKCNSRSERLKSLMAHELMHRITQDFESFRPSQNPSKHKAYIDLTNKLKEAYTKAINNGDAKRISTYATTNKSEFLSEANAMLEGGFEMPQYIKDVLLEVKEWNRRK